MLSSLSKSNVNSKHKSRLYILNGVQKRYFIFSFVRNLSRTIVVFITGGAIGGGYVMKQKYDGFKDSLPDIGSFSLPLPESVKNAKFDQVKSWLNDKYVNNNFINIDKLDYTKNEHLMNLKKWLDLKILGKENIDINEIEAMVEVENSKIAVLGENKAAMSQSELYIHKMKEQIVELQKEYELEKYDLQKEIELLKRQLLMDQRKITDQRYKIKKSLIEMYNDVLDTLEKFEELGQIQDELPRVVVIGEQSAGKTSVLEMIARARLFPRGSGVMTTKSPVKVTLGEGPFAVAKFDSPMLESDSSDKKDSNNQHDSSYLEECEYDLNTVKGQSELRAELEKRMDSNSTTVTKQPIGLSVKGPNINRAVLVDLPGIINTNTEEMESSTKQVILDMANQYMSNPNAIILCVIDASKDAENNSVVDIVKKIDPTGRRTIIVLTKIDQAEKQLADPDRIKKILNGEVFNLKSRGFYAVIAGKEGSDDDISKIKEYEEQYFRKSQLLKDGLLEIDHLTSTNLSRAVSQVFWRMVKDSVESQLNRFRAMKMNLDNEWRNKYNKLRELDRKELYEKARCQLLDNVVELSILSPTIWEDKLQTALWDKIKNNVFESIYFPSHQAEDFGRYKTTLENHIFPWITEKLGNDTIEVGWACVKQTLYELSMGATSIPSNKKTNNQDRELFAPFHREIEQLIFSRHLWDEKALPSLKIIQTDAMHDVPIRTKKEWDDAVDFLTRSLDDYLKTMHLTKQELMGPGFVESWTKWIKKSSEQYNRAHVFKEVESILNAEPNHAMRLADEEITAIKRNLRLKKISVDDVFIKDTWMTSYKLLILERARLQAKDCQKGYYHYHYGFQESGNFDCRDVLFFHRLQKLLRSSSSAMRNQIMNNEIQRLDKVSRKVLEEISNEPEKLKKLIKGNRVELAEKIKSVGNLIEKLEDFINALNREK